MVGSKRLLYQREAGLLKWRRRRKENNPEAPTRAQFKRAADNQTVRLEMRDQQQEKQIHESAIDMSNLPRVFLVANGESKTFETDQKASWSPSQLRLGKNSLS